PGLVSSIQELWGNQCVPLNVPIGHGHDLKGVVSTLKVPEDTAGALLNPQEIHEPLIESIIEVDEAMMERDFEGQMPSDEALGVLIRRAVTAGTLIPIVCVSSKTGVGLTELLDTIIACGPSPADVKRTAQQNGTEIEIVPDPNGPLIARVFKTRIDPFVQKLSFIRVYSGTLKKDMTVH